jgi:hypothetical protein
MGSHHAVGGHRTLSSTDALFVAGVSSIRNRARAQGGIQHEEERMTTLNWNRKMRAHVARLVVIAVIGGGTTSIALAESVKFDALVTQKEALRLDFADSSKHFFLLVRREGKSEGQGVLADATVQEYGAHDIVPGVGGEPRGYLEFAKADGDKAYIKWTIQAVFVTGPDGKPKLLDNGVWQVVGGTGKLERLKGAGTFHLVPTGPTERRFALEGELIQ